MHGTINIRFGVFFRLSYAQLDVFHSINNTYVADSDTMTAVMEDRSVVIHLPARKDQAGSGGNPVFYH